MAALTVQSRPSEAAISVGVTKPSSSSANPHSKTSTLHPYGIIRLSWDTFVLFLLLYTAIEIPLTISFELTLTLTNPLGIIAFTIDVLLLTDIVLNFRTQYYDKYDRLLLHIDPFDIARRYFKSWFWLDLFTSFPLEFVVDAGLKGTNFPSYLKALRVFRLLRIFKILRVIRVVRMFDGVTNTVQREVFFLLRFAKIFGLMILTAHYFACIWWAVGMYAVRNDSVENTWIEAAGLQPNDALFLRYSTSWYWSIVTLFTTGYGDIHAHNPIEMWVCSFCILIGSCFFAYFIGTLTSWVTEGDRIQAVQNAKVEEAQAFCRYHHFDREFTRTIITHIRYYCNYNFVFDSDSLLPLLPDFLQKEINQRIAAKFLANLDIFKNLPTEIIGQIALTMHSISCNADKYLYKKGDIATCMYLHRTGTAELRYDDGSEPRALKRGDVIGERAFISGVRRYSCKCLGWTEFGVINVESVKNVLRNNLKPKRFVLEWNRIKHIIKQTTTRENRVERTCVFAEETPVPQSDAATIIHSMSKHATTLRGEFMEKLVSPRKPTAEGQATPTVDVADGSGVYTQVALNAANDSASEDINQSAVWNSERFLSEPVIEDAVSGATTTANISEVVGADSNQSKYSNSNNDNDNKEESDTTIPTKHKHKSLATITWNHSEVFPETNEDTFEANTRPFAQSVPQLCKRPELRNEGSSSSIKRMGTTLAAKFTSKKHRAASLDPTQAAKLRKQQTKNSVPSKSASASNSNSRPRGFLKKMSPFLERHDSERRNEKLVNHTRKTKVKKQKRMTTLMQAAPTLRRKMLSTDSKVSLDEDYETDEADLDDDTDEEDVASNTFAVGRKSTTRLGSTIKSGGKRMGKFGGRKAGGPISSKPIGGRSMSPGAPKRSGGRSRSTSPIPAHVLISAIGGGGHNPPRPPRHCQLDQMDEDDEQEEEEEEEEYYDVENDLQDEANGYCKSAEVAGLSQKQEAVELVQQNKKKKLGKRSSHCSYSMTRSDSDSHTENEANVKAK